MIDLPSPLGFIHYTCYIHSLKVQCKIWVLDEIHITRTFLDSIGQLLCTLVVPLVFYLNKMFPKSCFTLRAWYLLFPVVRDLSFVLIDLVVDPTNLL